MKKGIGRIILGTVLVILQILSIAGNAKAGISTQLSFDSLGVFLYDLIFLVSHYFVGIVGVILMVSGFIAYRKGDQQKPAEEEVIIPTDEEELPGLTIPLSTIMPILISIFVVLLIIVLVLDKR